MKKNDNLGNKKLCCQYCQRKYKSLKTLRNHENSHKYKFQCRLCVKKFQTEEEKDEHLKRKHIGRPKTKKCKICPATIFHTEEEYLLHIEEVHKGKNVDYYMCSDCGKQFKTKSELTSHITSKCGTVKQFKCQVCGQELMTAGSLHNHMLRHNCDPSFMCRFCAKLFLTAGQLKVHERIHTYDKAFKCEVCGKGFCHRQSLITHSTLHTGIKPYQCENCGNSFSCVGNLLKHRKTHADSCGLIPLTTHRVKHPATKMKVKVNTPANSKLKQIEKQKALQNRLTAFKEKKLQQERLHSVAKDEGSSKVIITPKKEEKAEDIAESNDFYYATKENNDKVYELNETKNSNFMQEETNLEDLISYVKEEPKVEESESASSNNNCELALDDDDDDDDTILTALDFNNDSLDAQDAKELLSSNESENVKENLQSHENSKNISLATNNKKKATENTIKITKQEVEEFVKNRNIQNKEDIVCKYCKKSYSNAKWLYRHEKLLHEKDENNKEGNSDDSFQCNYCDASFITREERKTHQKIEHAKMLTCEDCDKIFSNIVSLRIHKNNFHKGLPRKVYTYMCEKCGHQFKQKSSLVYHEENNCGSGPLIQCNVCGKNFSSVHVRKSHMRVHDAEKKLLCKFCGKSFHWKGQLKIHERSHTGEKPFSCLYCPKAFAYRESLITHSSLHTGIKPHLCEACGSRFSCIGNLIKHRATHVNTCGIWYSKNKI